ncbi:hypothetical protein ACF3N7_05430 [Cruoricaptor ignavus]|uniref:hypothetical protein n=1 Tax=Cruoricaptor ignavus TaxID=1118202 RepID=UPI00370D71C1
MKNLLEGVLMMAVSLTAMTIAAPLGYGIRLQEGTVGWFLFYGGCLMLLMKGMHIIYAHGRRKFNEHLRCMRLRKIKRERANRK